MEKLKTLNNWICKTIIRNAVIGSSRSAYLALYNYKDCITENLFWRVFDILNEVCPLTSDLVLKLPYRAQHYYYKIWLEKELPF